MMSKKKKESEPEQQHVCGECANVTIETMFNTLSLEGKPTLGRCPHYTNGRYCVLLSQKSCEHFKNKNTL